MEMTFSAMSSYFEQSLRLFVEQQQALRDQMGQVMSGTDPFTMMRNMTEHNMSVWRGFQESMFRVRLVNPANRPIVRSENSHG